jgi:hypothetical protein
MMLNQEDAVKAELLGFADVIDIVRIDAAVARLLAGIGTRTTKQTKLHPQPHVSPALPLPL